MNSDFNNYSFKSIIREYFISIYLDNDEISIQVYNISLLDNIKYEINLDLNDMKNISYYLSSFNIIGIYDLFTKLLNNGQLNLEKQFENLVLSFYIKDIGIPCDNISGNKPLQFILFGEQDNNEYIKYLSGEVYKLKQQINQLTSNQNSFNNANANLNMNIQNMPNLNNNNFINQNNNANNAPQVVSNNAIAVDYNEYFNKLNVVINNNTNELDFDKKLVDDRLFNYLTNFELNQLTKLSIAYNRIEAIQGIEKSKFPNLEILNLNNNKINNLTFLSKANFPQLKRLLLSYNEISDISPLANANFTKLDVLALSQNELNDIYPLKNFKCKGLRVLTIDHNNISDISVFEYVPFKIQKLGLNDNLIVNVSVFGSNNFKEVKQVYLYNNSITDISPLGKGNLDNLNILSLNNNKINNINFLENPSLKQLKELYVENNQISDISVFTRINLNLTKLYIKGNKFDINNSSQVINSIKSKVGVFVYANSS